MGKIRIVFDGPPLQKPGRFIQVDDEHGKEQSVGEWVRDGDAWYLVIDDPRPLRAEHDVLAAENRMMRGEIEKAILQLNDVNGGRMSGVLYAQGYLRAALDAVGKGE